MLISLREIKTQISMAYVRDRQLDEFLRQKYFEAKDYAEQYMGRPIKLDSEERLNAGIRGALLMYIASAYQHREAYGNAPFHPNPAFESLLHFHRVNLGV